MFASRRESLVKAGAVAAALSVVVLSGCSQASPGVAAYVGGDEVTEKELAASYEAVSEAYGPDQQIDKRQVLSAMIRGEIAQQIAERNGVAVTDAERDAMLASTDDGPILLAHAEAKLIGYDLVDANLVAGKLGEEKFVAEFQARKVELNPRYGAWRDVIVDESTSLSQPVAPDAPQ